MDLLPYDILNIIFEYADLTLYDLINCKKICKFMYIALNSKKLSHLYHGKYIKIYKTIIPRDLEIQYMFHNSEYVMDFPRSFYSPVFDRYGCLSGQE